MLRSRFYGYKELRDDSRHGRRSINIAGLQLLAAHALQLLLSLDFLFYYVRRWGERAALTAEFRST